MKKIFAFAIAAVALTVGCQKFQELVRPGNDSVNEDEYAAYPVSFGANVATVSTKAAIDEVGGLAQDSIFVYGVNNADKTLLIDRYKITTPLATENTIKDVYYGASKETYSFYGYYAGAQVTAPNYASGVITVPVTITGQEDLMIGLTDKQNDLDNRTIKGDAPLIEELYSAKSARRGVRPNLVFEHKLVRFDFVFTDGTGLELSPDKSVWVERLDITSVAAGELVITHNKNTPTGVLNPTGGATVLNLGKLETEWTDTENSWTPLVKFGYEAQPLAAGAGTIMVMPAASYPVTLHLNQTNATKIAEQPLTLSMPAGAEFEAGKKYEVKIKVYGMEAVVVDIEVKEWGEGGSFEYDPDEDTTPLYVLGETQNAKFAADGGKAEYKLNVESKSWTVSVEGENTEWLTVSPAAGEIITTDSKVTITAAKNTETSERTATVKFTAGEEVKTIMVTQEGAQAGA